MDVATALPVSTFGLRHSFVIAHSVIGHLPKAWLCEEGREQRDEAGQIQRRGLDRETVRKVKEKGGKLSRAQLLRCRVRYFTDGVAIGSKAFIENVFRERRDHFGPKRKDGARAIKESDTVLFSLRNLRVQAVE